MKAIKKVLDFYDTIPEIYSLYEEFRIEHSRILNEKEIKGTLCFSIHPMDFITMSDNNYDWSSCMSWIKNGCYHIGTVEMMNSNNVICVYLKGKEDFSWDFKDHTYSWSNKKWRQLFYVTKEIIVGGKAYPYSNKDFTFKALEVLRDLAKTNWNHTYAYGIEPYKDMKHIYEYDNIRDNQYWIRKKLTTKHNIIFHSKGMYNDMLNDHDTTYYCIRNKVKKNTLITYSGKAKCLCCNNNVLSENTYADTYNDRYDGVGRVLCAKCYDDTSCCCCGNNLTDECRLYKIKNNIYCYSCLQESYSICPFCGEIFTKDSMWNIRDKFNDIKVFFMKPNLNDNFSDLLVKENIDESKVKYFKDLDFDFRDKYQIVGCSSCLKELDNYCFTNGGYNVKQMPFGWFYSKSNANINLIHKDELKNFLTPGRTVEDCFNKTIRSITLSDIEPYSIY